MGRGRPRALSRDARPLRGDRAAGAGRRASPSAEACGSLAGAESAATTRRGRPQRRLGETSAGPWLARDARACASPRGSPRRSGRRAAGHAPALSGGRRALARSLPGSASAPASPTTWGSARRSRCSRSSSLRKQAQANEPQALASSSRRPRSSATGRRRSRASPRPERMVVTHRAVGRANGSKSDRAPELATSTSSITSYGSLAAARLARRRRAGGWRPRRGAGDQEPRRQADPRRQGARRRGAHRAHRHAGREQSRRSLVDLRLPQSRACSARRRRSPASPSASPTATPPILRAAAQARPRPTSCGA